MIVLDPKHASWIVRREGKLIETCPFCEAGYNVKNEMCIPVLSTNGEVVSLKVNPKSAKAIQAILAKRAANRKEFFDWLRRVANKLKELFV